MKVAVKRNNVALDHTNSLKVLLVEGDGDMVVALRTGKTSAVARLSKQMKWTRESAGQNHIFSNGTQRKMC